MVTNEACFALVLYSHIQSKPMVLKLLVPSHNKAPSNFHNYVSKLIIRTEHTDINAHCNVRASLKTEQYKAIL